MKQDAELLRCYAADRSEAAMTELIGRHVDLVYSAALRVVNGDTHRAEDVTQQVLVELAREAKALAEHPALIGWLYTTTRRMALRAIRTEQRRQRREQEAHLMNEILGQQGADPGWNHIRPVLEEAMHELDENERVAVLLRFFKNRSLKEIGLELGLSDNTARMRVTRALEKLRLTLQRRGIATSAAALSVTLLANAVQAAPTGLSFTISTAAGLSGSSATSATTPLTKAITMTKIQKTIIGAALAAAVGTGFYELHHGHLHRHVMSFLATQRGGRVSEISFKGNTRFTEAQLMEILVSRVGEPFDQQKVDKDVAAVWKKYRDAGQANVPVRAAQETDKRSGQTTVTFVVGETPAR